MKKYKVELYGNIIEITQNENGKFVFPYEEYSKYKTALKPAHEPIALAQKPLEKGLTYAQSTLKWGVGGLNIGGCRIPLKDGEEAKISIVKEDTNATISDGMEHHKYGNKKTGKRITPEARYPANVIHDGSEEVIDSFPNTKKGGAIRKDYQINNNIYGDMSMLTSNHTEGFGDSGSAARFFYGAKAQGSDRDQGLDGHTESNPYPNNFKGIVDKAGNLVAENVSRKNIHPTVKPTDLMQYLVRLVTPKNGTTMDIFMGSGSTGKAAMVENIINKSNYKFIGIDMTEEYLPIARDRIVKGSKIFARNLTHGKPKKVKVDPNQLGLDI